MDEYYLLTYIENEFELDLTKEESRNKIKMVPVNLDYIENITQNIENDKIQVLGIEPYSLLQFKNQIMKEYIDSQSINK